MIAGCSPRMIFSQQKRLVEPNFPKYMPFTQINSLIALKFNIPVLSQPVSPTGKMQLATQPFFSLQASCPSHGHPFAGLAQTFDRSLPLAIPLELEVPFTHLPVFESPNLKGAIATVSHDAHKHARVMSNLNTVGVMGRMGVQIDCFAMSILG